MNRQSLRFDTRLNQSLTPRLQYAVRLLQLSALDYEQELQNVSGKNPFLELEDGASSWNSVSVAESGSMGADSRDAASNSDQQNDEAFDRDRHCAEGPAGSDGNVIGDGGLDGDAWSTESWVQSPGVMRDGGREGQGSAIDTMAAETDVRQHLRSQANLLPISPRDHTLVCAVIESLDDDGYLRLEVEDIAGLCDLEPVADESELSMAVKLVQSFGPVGVGARSVAECLLLQLETVDASLRALARTIVTDHLDRLAQRDVPGMARLLARPPSDIEAACNALRRHDPRPGWHFGRSDVHFVTPDVFVRKVRGKWVAQLNAAVVPRLRLNRTYVDLFQRHRDSRHGEMGTYLQEARWTLRNVGQRCSTILAVSQAILRRQYGFFEHGPLAMKPLALRDIAVELGMHESTVCRVTNNKYMATPAGLFELKQFFSRPMAMAGGGACSPTAIRGVLKELVDAEDLSCPLSDVDIAQRLERQGLKVARRTVTKYRQMLRIPPADRRRSHTNVSA